MHTPVLLQKVINSLDIKPGGLYIDATYGEGGHAIEISKRGGKVLAIDADFDQVKSQNSKVSDVTVGVRPPTINVGASDKSSEKIKLVRGNFKDIEEIAKENGFYPVDGVLFDLGLSMQQINESGRGFSYKKLEEPLDMRLDQASQKTASDIINSFSQKELYEIFTKNSEELNSRSISQAIVRARKVRPINQVGDLIRIIDLVLKAHDEKVYKRIFQALRIEVNDEFINLQKGLTGAVKILKNTGRIVVISFHSLEDRIVKQFIRNQGLKEINKKVILGKKSLSYEKSAKMRVISL